MISENVEKAAILYELGRQKEAIEILEKNQIQYEDGLSAWIYVSALTDLNRFEKALKAVNKGIGKHPDYWALLLLRAELYKELKLYSKAIVDIDKALRMEPDEPFVHLEASSLFLATDDYNKALEHADEVLALDPENIYARVIKANTLYQKDLEQEALALAEEALSLDPDNPLTLGLMAELSKNRVEKVIFLRKALRLNPSDKLKQQELKYQTKGLKGDILIVIALALTAFGLKLGVPGQFQPVVNTTIYISGPVILIYFSRRLFLASVLLFSYLALLFFLDETIVLKGEDMETIGLNISYLLFLMGVSFAFTYICKMLRAFIQISFDSLQGKWFELRRSKESNTVSDYLKEAVLSKRTYFYFIGSVVIPSVNAVIYQFFPQYFWFCFMFSVVLMVLSLKFLARKTKVKALLSNTLMYGFLTISVTVLLAAWLGSGIITHVGLFLGAVAGSHIAYFGSAQHSDR